MATISVEAPSHQLADAEILTRIVQTLGRLAQIDARHIEVSVHNNVVTLRGDVRCWSERQIVEQVAWAAPAVHGVHDQLVLPY